MKDNSMQPANIRNALRETRNHVPLVLKRNREIKANTKNISDIAKKTFA
jgi:hypothetical protein